MTIAPDLPVHTGDGPPALPVTVTPAPAPESQVTARDTALQAIVTETGCTPVEAEACYGLAARFVDGARTGGGIMHPDDADMSGREYVLFDKVVPHDAEAAPGSAHEALQVALLDPTKGEQTILHSDLGTPPRRFCSVIIHVD